ncbi:hypothetical protein V9T40_009884 [Parthenolecanium corni]|uniref:Uncharacterized protein n=1 Tax=Parthenolecanium corni TaxID=536013 RepID=A0AAN9TMM8_9HEMI
MSNERVGFRVSAFGTWSYGPGRFPLVVVADDSVAGRRRSQLVGGVTWRGAAQPEAADFSSLLLWRVAIVTIGEMEFESNKFSPRCYHVCRGRIASHRIAYTRINRRWLARYENTRIRDRTTRRADDCQRPKATNRLEIVVLVWRRAELLDYRNASRLEWKIFHCESVSVCFISRVRDDSTNEATVFQANFRF